MDEKQLVKDCLKGKRQSQKLLYEQFAPKMLGVCYRYAHHKEEAEDFLQEAFITIFRKLNQFKNEGSLAGWIFKIVINTSLNCLKSKYKLTEHLDDFSLDNSSLYIFPSVEGSEKDLMQFIQALPLGYRTIFNLYAIEGYSHDEIGEMLGIKAGTSRSQYTRARQVLSQRINKEQNVSSRGQF
ncbi:MAG: sigma-70 family RNA polymerase sigma factor [Bacteroidetes bacterium]|nr:sigma-70 family RNA polymerase sigma factor [Bacteroidota bacterium]